jgi:hypothetical protein
MDGIQLSDRLHLLHGREAIPTILLGAALPVMEIKKRKIVGVHNPFDLGNFLLTIERVLTHSSPRHYSISGG